MSHFLTKNGDMAYAACHYLSIWFINEKSRISLITLDIVDFFRSSEIQDNTDVSKIFSKLQKLISFLGIWSFFEFLQPPYIDMALLRIHQH